jgi:hypothetical protein
MFNPYNPPEAPREPSKTKIKKKVLTKYTGELDTKIPVDGLPEDTAYLEISNDGDFDYMVEFCEDVEVPNPTYETEMEIYKIKLEHYQEKMAEWTLLKEKYHADERNKRIEKLEEELKQIRGY